MAVPLEKTTVAHNRGKYKHDFRQVHCMRIHGRRSVEERGSNAEPSMGNNKKTKKGTRKTQEKKSNHTEELMKPQHLATA